MARCGSGAKIPTHTLDHTLISHIYIHQCKANHASYNKKCNTEIINSLCVLPEPNSATTRQKRTMQLSRRVPQLQIVNFLWRDHDGWHSRTSHKGLLHTWSHEKWNRDYDIESRQLHTENKKQNKKYKLWEKNTQEHATMIFFFLSFTKRKIASTQAPCAERPRWMLCRMGERNENYQKKITMGKRKTKTIKTKTRKQRHTKSTTTVKWVVELMWGKKRIFSFSERNVHFWIFINQEWVCEWNVV